MDTGPFFSGTLVHPSAAHPGAHTIKAIAVKLGDRQQAGICYDTELLRVSCGWTGGFVKFSPSRFGLISPQAIEGAVQFASPRQPGCTPTGRFDDQRAKPPYGPLPRDVAHYEGLSLHGNRVVLRYMIGKTRVLESPWVESSGKALLFTRELSIAAGTNELRLLVSDGKSLCRLIGPTHGATLPIAEGGPTVAILPPRANPIRIKLAIWADDPALQAEQQALVSASPECLDLEALTTRDTARWGEPLVTRGVVSTKADPYVLDTLTVPFENRYHALMFLSGHDFFANGDAAVCTAHGDVWRVGGIDDKLEQITWRRVATGLFQPLGLKIVKNAQGTEQVYVLGRDQITILHDQNQDGEADFYENFNNEGQTTTNAHEFATCLETDSKGNFYYLKGDSGSQTQHDGCLLRVTPDGRKLDVFATGFRNGNGLSIGPDDTLTVAPQEGNWTPGSAIFQVREGGFYGAMQSHHRATAPTTYDPPICWIPRLQDNSSGGQAWVTGDRWGFSQGQLLHFSFGTCRMFLVLRESLSAEATGKQVQGGLVQFPLLFDSGVMRGRFRTKDGQLYVTGLKGWVSSAVQDGCFQRVRYTGRPADFPIQMRTFSNGIALTFTEPLDRASAEDPDNYGVEAWNYLWSGNYGSPELKVSQPTQVGHDDIEVASATLLSDDRTVYLELPELRPAMQVGINYTLTAQSGRPIQQTYYATLHKLGNDSLPEPLTRKPRPGQLPREVEQALPPGLVLKIDADAGSARPERYAEQGVSRLAAFYLPKSTVESVVGSATPVWATWNGYLKIPQRGDYEFRIETRGKAGLTIAGHDVALNEPTPLRRGYQPLTLKFEGDNSEVDVRLLWKSTSFPWEAVPPNLLFHLPDAALQNEQVVHAGSDLFHQHGCANCHAAPAATAAAKTSRESRLIAPQLGQLGSRLNAPWIAAWIQQPRRLRSEASMPALFHGQDVAADKQAIADLAAFLASGSSADEPTTADAKDADAGLQLYESLGCMGCHRFTSPETTDLHQRVSLHYVGAKFPSGQMAEFLRNPRQHSPQIRMPDFRLTAAEAHSLENYLRSMSEGKFPALAELATADVKRGQQRFETVGCRHCHQLAPRDDLQSGRQTPVWGRDQLTGCLLKDAPAGSPHPHYEFADPERHALARYLAKSATFKKPEFDLERGQRLVKRLNCAACHSRDGKNSPLAELVGDEGQGLPPEPLPHLTWVGEKLRTDWMDRLLHGKLTYQSRPWLKARMPSFPDNHLATVLAAEHGIRFDIVPQRQEIRPELAELGRQLTLKGQGLDCRQCHGVGNEGPSGDKSTLISVGINFSVTRDRLNPEFFPRLLLNPPRYDPNSRMPVFAVDGKTTAAKAILDGDAERQYEALWEYLGVLKK